MSNRLISTIDALIAFADQNNDTPLTSELGEELQRLDAELYAVCHIAGVTIPDHQRPAIKDCHLFGNSKLPYFVARSVYPSRDEGGAYSETQGPWSQRILMSQAWRQAMLTLRVTTELLQGDGAAGQEGCTRTGILPPGQEEVACKGDDPPQWLFARSGTGYYIAGFGESGHLSGYKGFMDIARLIATPGVRVPMLDLEGADQNVRNDRRSRQPGFDAQALKQTREQLQELRADLEKAEEENNTVEADSAREQIEELERWLRSAKGLGGKVRDLNNQFDKLRPKIHGRLRTVYEAMRKADPPMNSLADHFELSISSEGVDAFVYRPAGDHPRWQLHLDSGK